MARPYFSRKGVIAQNVCVRPATFDWLVSTTDWFQSTRVCVVRTSKCSDLAQTLFVLQVLILQAIKPCKIAVWSRETNLSALASIEISIINVVVAAIAGYIVVNIDMHTHVQVSL